jgi:hypothetical protein
MWRGTPYLHINGEDAQAVRGVLGGSSPERWVGARRNTSTSPGGAMRSESTNQVGSFSCWRGHFTGEFGCSSQRQVMGRLGRPLADFGHVPAAERDGTNRRSAADPSTPFSLTQTSRLESPCDRLAAAGHGAYDRASRGPSDTLRRERTFDDSHLEHGDHATVRRRGAR